MNSATEKISGVRTSSTLYHLLKINSITSFKHVSKEVLIDLVVKMALIHSPLDHIAQSVHDGLAGLELGHLQQVIDQER